MNLMNPAHLTNHLPSRNSRRTPRRYRGLAFTTSVMFALGMAVLAPLSARGQATPGPDGTVTANGTASIERNPELLRMQVALSAEGKDAREALTKLKDQEQAAREKLKKLGAAEASIDFGDPQAMAGDRRQQMEQMIRQRTGRARPTTGPAQPGVTISVTLKAEWPLKGRAAEDLLVEAQELQGKVKAANLTSAAAAKPKTPEEEEEAEEAAALQTQNGEANPNEAAYFFVSKISDEDRAKATADAFKKARAEAERLAKASGTELGALRQLTGNAGPDLDRYANMNEYGGQYQRYFYGMMQRMQQGETPDSGEAIGIQPGKVTYRVMVAASFALK
jgi:uncharacterized protein YggE